MLRKSEEQKGKFSSCSWHTKQHTSPSIDILWAEVSVPRTSRGHSQHTASRRHKQNIECLSYSTAHYRATDNISHTTGSAGFLELSKPLHFASRSENDWESSVWDGDEMSTSAEVPDDTAGWEVDDETPSAVELELSGHTNTSMGWPVRLFNTTVCGCCSTKQGHPQHSNAPLEFWTGTAAITLAMRYKASWSARHKTLPAIKN